MKSRLDVVICEFKCSDTKMRCSEVVPGLLLFCSSPVTCTTHLDLLYIREISAK